MNSSKIQKGALITIIVLLLIFVPLTISAFYFKLSGRDTSKENVNKEFHFDNKLWFYDDTGSLLGTYECETANCDLAVNFENDKEYSLASISNSESISIPIYHNQYAFLRDESDASSHKAFLFDIKSGKAYKEMTYEAVKNYGVGIADDMLILENDSHKFGVMKIGAVMMPLLSFEYDFIGLLDSRNEDGEVLADYFVTLKDGFWSIISQSGAVVAENIVAEIVSFNGTYIITHDNSNVYHLIDFQNNDVLGQTFKNLSFTDRYLNCFTNDNYFYVYDLMKQEIISEEYSLRNKDQVDTKINAGGNLEIYINEKLKATVTL